MSWCPVSSFCTFRIANVQSLNAKTRARGKFRVMACAKSNSHSIPSQNELTRAQLQGLAKDNGIRANLKSADIIAALQAKGISLNDALSYLPPETKKSQTKLSSPESKGQLNPDGSRLKPSGDQPRSATNIQEFMLDTLDAFDIEELNAAQIEEELTRRGLPLEGDSEVGCTREEGLVYRRSF